MKVFKKILLISLLSLTTVSGFAQFSTEEQFDSIENLILYNKIQTFGIVIHNLGMGFNFRKGKRLSIFKTRLWEVEGVYVSSYKQKKMQNPYFANSRRYIYGKLNDLFFLRGGIAWKKLLNDKPEWMNGVEVRFHYGFGATLGITKPYYLYVIYFFETTPGYYDYEIKTERFDPSKLSWDDIYGRAPFTKGIDEISLHPGAYVKASLNFEFGNRDTKVKALEVGAIIDFTPTGPQIMSEQVNKYVYPTLYISYQFGKRFNEY